MWANNKYSGTVVELHEDVDVTQTKTAVKITSTMLLCAGSNSNPHMNAWECPQRESSSQFIEK